MLTRIHYWWDIYSFLKSFFILLVAYHLLSPELRESWNSNRNLFTHHSLPVVRYLFWFSVFCKLKEEITFHKHRKRSVSPFLYSEVVTFTPNKFIRLVNRILPNRRVKVCTLLTFLLYVLATKVLLFLLSFLQLLLQHCTFEVRWFLTERTRSHYRSTATRCALVRSLTICSTYGAINTFA